MSNLERIACLLGNGAMVALLALGLSQRPDSGDCDTEIYETDGEIVLDCGERRYFFAPNVARAVGVDMVAAADEAEGGAL